MLLYDTKYLQLKSTKSKTGNDWVYAHRPNVSGVVVILPIIEKTKVLFLIEERPPLNAENVAQYSVALPAGLVGDERNGETKEDAIRAELLEEGGMRADKIEILADNVASSAGCLSESFTIAAAFVNKYELVQKPVTDGGVIVDRVLVDIDNIDLWLKSKTEEGMALTSHTLASMYYLKTLLEKEI